MNWDLAALQAYITDGVEESLCLDYKAADALQKSDGKKKEIAKDVSAMANSAGGVIIYGIKEYQEKDKAHLPELIDPVKRSDISKEWLEQVVSANIQPKINGVIISPIAIDADNVVYVVEIPQSGTAHQASDKRYYKRYNFESVAMEDYEIRDIMGRVKHPIVELDFLIEWRNVHERDGITFNIRPDGQKWVEYFLKVAIKNMGKVYASYVNYQLELPDAILQDADNLKDSPTRLGYKVYYGENTVRDVVDVIMQPFGSPSYRYGPSRFDPILPQTKGRSETIQLIKNLVNRGYKLFWKIYVDNAEERKGEVSLSELLTNAEYI